MHVSLVAVGGSYSRVMVLRLLLLMVKVAQSCLTLCDPSGLNTPGKAMSSGSSKASQAGAWNSGSLRNAAVDCAVTVGLIRCLLHNLLFTFD